jgi:hypothetical protein
MTGDHWQPARLIPTSGISGQEEAERRATSALLAVMGAVREFGLAMVKPLGAPAGPLQTFIEVPFRTADDRTCFPDGLVQTSRAGRTWTALVEVKTGSAELERAQVESYLDVARDSGFDIVLTISNQMSPAPGVHPVDVDRRKIRKVGLCHMSWAEVLTVAVQQRVHRGVSDPDQAWILGELIRYLEHPRSGALDFSDMGAAWVPIREAVAAGTLRAHDKGLADVVSRWEQLLRFAALRLGRELGADVQVVVSRKEAAEPALRFAAQTQSLVESGRLTGTLRISDAAAPLDVCADLRIGRVTVSADVDAPREGRATTRVGWLVRQLKDAPDGLRIDASSAGSRSSMSALLRAVQENPNVLVEDPRRELRTFRIAAASPLGPKRGTGRGGFIDSVLVAIDGFYAAVLQQLRPWAAKAPQLPKGGRTAAEEAGIDITVPEQDLEEPVAVDLVAPVPPDSPAPTTVMAGVEAAAERIDDEHDRRAAAAVETPASAEGHDVHEPTGSEASVSDAGPAATRADPPDRYDNDGGDAERLAQVSVTAQVFGALPGVWDEARTPVDVDQVPSTEGSMVNVSAIQPNGAAATALTSDLPDVDLPRDTEDTVDDIGAEAPAAWDVPTAVVGDEIVSWDGARDRLEHERAAADTAAPNEDPQANPTRPEEVLASSDRTGA